MAEFHADRSLLVKRHIREAGTPWFRTIADPASGNVIITARVGVIGVYSAFNRRVREGTIDPITYATLIADFAGVCAAEYRLTSMAW